MADQVKGDVVADGGSDSGLGEAQQVTTDDLYGGLEVSGQPSSGDEAAPYEALAITTTAVDVEKTDNVPEVPTPEPEETESKVAEPPKAEPDKEPEDVKEKELSEKPPWDVERQKRDQERANLRKETEALKLQLAERDLQIAEKDAVLKRGQMANTTRPSDDVLAEIEALPVVNPLDDPDAYVDTQKKMLALQKELARANRLETENIVVQATAPRRDSDAFEAILDNVCGKDRAVRQEVIYALQQEWEQKGYAEGNYPNAREVEAIARWKHAEYLLKQKDGGTAKPKPTVTPATGKSARGAGSNRLRPSASIADAIRDLS